MALDAELILGFSKAVLAKRYDNFQPFADFHMKLWELCCRPERQVAIAAPRGHSKSTSITHAYTLANVLFRERSYIIIVSDTEEQAKEFLGDIKLELKENEDLKALFDFKELIKETETVIEGEFEDGHVFRIIAKGAEQKVRGRKWRGRRPDLIIVDDLENDELVMNKDRRDKLKRWFTGALVPSLSKHGIIRVVGTIMHMDSLLESLMPPIDSKATVNEPLVSYSNARRPWLSYRFRAHDDEYENILWPEMFEPEDFRMLYEERMEQGLPDIYSQEYLNYPIDESSAFFRQEDIRPIKSYDEPLTIYAAADFAISDAARADFTVIVVAGVNENGVIKIIDVLRGRWDTYEILDNMFAVQERYNPDLFTVETGPIQKALGPAIEREMHERDIYINLNPMNPDKDKKSRARGIQGRMRAGAVEFDIEAPWFQTLQSEMLRFPKDKHDDQVDALSWIGLTLNKLREAPTREEIEEEEYLEELEEYEDSFFIGSSSICGY